MFQYPLLNKEIPRDAVDVERGKHDIEIFELWFCAQPTAIDPYQAKRQAEHHRRKLPPLYKTDCAGNTQTHSSPFQLLLKSCKPQKYHLNKDFLETSAVDPAI